MQSKLLFGGALAAVWTAAAGLAPFPTPPPNPFSTINDDLIQSNYTACPNPRLCPQIDFSTLWYGDSCPTTSPPFLGPFVPEGPLPVTAGPVLLPQTTWVPPQPPAFANDFSPIFDQPTDPRYNNSKGTNFLGSLCGQRTFSTQLVSTFAANCRRYAAASLGTGLFQVDGDFIRSECQGEYLAPFPSYVCNLSAPSCDTRCIRQGGAMVPGVCACTFSNVPFGVPACPIPVAEAAITCGYDGASFAVICRLYVHTQSVNPDGSAGPPWLDNVTQEYVGNDFPVDPLACFADFDFFVKYNQRPLNFTQSVDSGGWLEPDLVVPAMAFHVTLFDLPGGVRSSLRPLFFWPTPFAPSERDALVGSVAARVTSELPVAQGFGIVMCPDGCQFGSPGEALGRVFSCGSTGLIDACLRRLPQSNETAALLRILNETLTELAECRAQVANLTALLAQAEQDLEDALQELDDLLDVLIPLLELAADLQDDVDALEEALRTAKQRLRECEETVPRLRSKNASLWARIEQLSGFNATCDQALSDVPITAGAGMFALAALLLAALVLVHVAQSGAAQVRFTASEITFAAFSLTSLVLLALGVPGAHFAPPLRDRQLDLQPQPTELSIFVLGTALLGVGLGAGFEALLQLVAVTRPGVRERVPGHAMRATLLTAPHAAFVLLWIPFAVGLATSRDALEVEDWDVVFAVPWGVQFFVAVSLWAEMGATTLAADQFESADFYRAATVAVALYGVTAAVTTVALVIAGLGFVDAPFRVAASYVAVAAVVLVLCAALLTLYAATTALLRLKDAQRLRQKRGLLTRDVRANLRTDQKYRR